MVVSSAGQHVFPNMYQITQQELTDPSISLMASRAAGYQSVTCLLFLASDPPCPQRRHHCLSSRTRYFRKRAVLPRCPYARPSRSLDQSAWQGQQRTGYRLEEEEEEKMFLASQGVHQIRSQAVAWASLCPSFRAGEDRTRLSLAR